jgi:uncharacterized protein YjbI with pentapeptide repeats
MSDPIVLLRTTDGKVAFSDRQINTVGKFFAFVRISSLVVSNYDFKDMDLSNLDLSGLDLSGCCFEECDLRGTNLAGCDVRGASFCEALINGATSLRGLKFTTNELAGIILSGSSARFAE